MVVVMLVVCAGADAADYGGSTGVGCADGDSNDGDDYVRSASPATTTTTTTMTIFTATTTTTIIPIMYGIHRDMNIYIYTYMCIYAH